MQIGQLNQSMRQSQVNYCHVTLINTEICLSIVRARRIYGGLLCKENSRVTLAYFPVAQGKSVAAAALLSTLGQQETYYCPQNLMLRN